MRRLLSALSVLFLAWSGPVSAASSNPLYEELSRAGEVKVYVAAPTDASGKAGLDLEGLRKALAEALKNRKSIRFSVVDNEADAQLKVETALQGFMYTDHDPVDMLVGVGAAAMDAATIEHYCSTEARMTVRDKSGREKWKGPVRATLTDATMTEAESRVKILPRLSEMFVRQAFGKKSGA